MQGDDEWARRSCERGLEIRKAVLGKEFVEKSFASADDFNRPLQELVTEYCWGAVWGREGLPRKTRSMLNLAMLSALNRPHELKMHVKGALRNGVSREEIREVLLQVGIYCGVPAAVDAFRIARETFAEIDGKAQSLTGHGGGPGGAARRRSAVRPACFSPRSRGSSTVRAAGSCQCSRVRWGDRTPVLCGRSKQDAQRLPAMGRPRGTGAPRHCVG